MMMMMMMMMINKRNRKAYQERIELKELKEREIAFQLQDLIEKARAKKENDFCPLMKFGGTKNASFFHPESRFYFLFKKT